METAYRNAKGNEISSGKFDNPESSANLAANVFGFFFISAIDLSPLPGCADEEWPAISVALEQTVRLPWRGGRHPVLDVLVTTPSALIGIECKRFEPFRRNRVKSLPNAYWRQCWGDRMRGFEQVRDEVGANRGGIYSLDTAQLFKHAFALRTQVNKLGENHGLNPVLLYVYAEPESWPTTGLPLSEAAIQRHRQEIAGFAATVEGDEVKFLSCSYRQLLEDWQKKGTGRVSRHASRVGKNFAL